MRRGPGGRPRNGRSRPGQATRGLRRGARCAGAPRRRPRAPPVPGGRGAGGRGARRAVPADLDPGRGQRGDVPGRPPTAARSRPRTASSTTRAATPTASGAGSCATRRAATRRRRRSATTDRSPGTRTTTSSTTTPTPPAGRRRTGRPRRRDDLQVRGPDAVRARRSRRPSTVHFTGGLGERRRLAATGSGSLPLLDPQPPVAPGGAAGARAGYPARRAASRLRHRGEGGRAGRRRLVLAAARRRLLHRRPRAHQRDRPLPRLARRQIRLDRRTQSISSTGPVEVRVGPLLPAAARMLALAQAGVLRQEPEVPRPAGEGRRQLTLEGGRTKLTMSVGRPRRSADPPADPARAPVRAT